MTLPSPFSLPYSEFNEFLFAPIGEEANGLPLSVVSALARLDIDPWQEAARLTALPKELATSALDSSIRRLPAGRWSHTDTRKIAVRLIGLLPRRGIAAPSGKAGPGARAKASPSNVAWLIIAALGGALLFATLANGTPRSEVHGVAAAISNGTSPLTGP